jgi:hypothetical protein
MRELCAYMRYTLSTLYFTSPTANISLRQCANMKLCRQEIFAVGANSEYFVEKNEVFFKSKAKGNHIRLWPFRFLKWKFALVKKANCCLFMSLCT